MLHIEDIVEIRKATSRPGYEIVFPDNKASYLSWTAITNEI